ncbi:MAG: mycothiol synthase [Bowdeniella nasicola]|nr:mycothiol synthase [Bowdeniella nasicola]
MSQPMELDHERAHQLRALAARIEEHDGIAAFGAAALTDLDRPEPRDEYAVIVQDGEPVAFAWCDGASAELGVHPDHRRAGLGSRLLTEVYDRHPSVGVWAHGTLPAARRLAEREGLSIDRELWFMEVDLTPIEELITQDPGQVETELTPPEGMVIRAFTPEDEDALLEVNAAAFAHHPEQGQLDAPAFAELRAQDWFEPHLLRVVVDEAAGRERLAGFVWLKPVRPGVIELFVLGVHPDYQGRRLGTLLIREGLVTAINMGATRAELYVDGADDVATHSYERQGFQHTGTDTHYVRETPLA